VDEAAPPDMVSEDVMVTSAPVLAGGNPKPARQPEPPLTPITTSGIGLIGSGSPNTVEIFFSLKNAKIPRAASFPAPIALFLDEWNAVVAGGLAARRSTCSGLNLHRSANNSGGMPPDLLPAHIQVCPITAVMMGKRRISSAFICAASW
jgi:hypothetical protein